MCRERPDDASHRRVDSQAEPFTSFLLMVDMNRLKDENIHWWTAWSRWCNDCSTHQKEKRVDLPGYEWCSLDWHHQYVDVHHPWSSNQETSIMSIEIANGINRNDWHVILPSNLVIISNLYWITSEPPKGLNPWAKLYISSCIVFDSPWNQSMCIGVWSTIGPRSSNWYSRVMKSTPKR